MTSKKVCAHSKTRRLLSAWHWHWACLPLRSDSCRGESASELRTLTATGATSGTRRALTAATAGGLAFLGVVLGTVGAYSAMIATHLSKLGALTPVPTLNLVVIAVGTPLIAAGTGWLLTGREPAALTRQLVQ